MPREREPGPAPASHAVSTTTNVGYSDADYNGACLNGGGGDPVNCNIYEDKRDVWLSGLPNAAALERGTYSFAVLAPGGQPNPNDGSGKNLSDVSPTSNPGTGDAYTDRTFEITNSNGTISYSGNHQFYENKLNLYGYDDTTKPGGVYILAVCKISSSNDYPVKASDCQYDAFKVKQANPVASGLVVPKDAVGSYDKTYVWDIDKSVDKATVTKLNGNATFNYTVAVGHDAGTNSNIALTGTITVFNPNDAPVTGVDVTDPLSNGTVCTVAGGANATVPSGDTTFAYSCTVGSVPEAQLDKHRHRHVACPDA